MTRERDPVMTAYNLRDLATALEPKGTTGVVLLRTVPFIEVDQAFVEDCIMEMHLTTALDDRLSKLQQLGAWLLLDSAGFERNRP